MSLNGLYINIYKKMPGKMSKKTFSVLTKNRTGLSPIKNSIESPEAFPDNVPRLEGYFEQQREIDNIKRLEEKGVIFKKLLVVESNYYFKCVSPLGDQFVVDGRGDRDIVVDEDSEHVIIEGKKRVEDMDLFLYDGMPMPIIDMDMILDDDNPDQLFERISKVITREQSSMLESGNKVYENMVELMKTVNQNSYNLYSLYDDSKDKVKNEKTLANNFVAQSWEKRQTFTPEQEDKFSNLKKRKGVYDQIISRLVVNMKTVSKDMRSVIDQNQAIIFQNVNLWVQTALFLDDKRFNANYWILPGNFTDLDERTTLELLSGDEDLFQDIVTEFLSENESNIRLLTEEKIVLFQDVKQLVRESFTNDILLKGNGKFLPFWNKLISIVVLKDLIDNYTKDVKLEVDKDFINLSWVSHLDALMKNELETVRAPTIPKA